MKLTSYLNLEKALWILEDDPESRTIYQEILETRYQLYFFETLEAFRQAIDAECSPPHLCIIDLRLSDGNFLNFLRDKETHDKFQLPFIVASCTDDLDIQRACFQDGALDYISKPFKRNDLIIKVERFFERGRYPTQNTSQDLVLDPESLRVKLGDTKGAQLTAKELQIFSLLFQAKGNPLAREEVKLKVWGDTNVSPKTLDVHLFHLRKKLRALGIEIRFTPLGGYYLSRTKSLSHRPIEPPEAKIG